MQHIINKLAQFAFLLVIMGGIDYYFGEKWALFFGLALAITNLVSIKTKLDSPFNR